MRKQDRNLIIENVEIYQYYKERLENLALSQFQWHGLPDTCDRLYFEKTLLYNGKGALYKPRNLDFWMSTNFLHKGGFNDYGYPAGIVGITFNGKQVQTDEYMILYDNMTKASLIPKIDMYARLLWEIHNTFRSNLQQQITPYLITTTKTQSLSFQNIFNQILGFKPVVELKTNFNPDDIKTLDLKVDFKGKELQDCLKSTWADALSMLGITAETTKKERLLKDEITVDRQEDLISLNSRLMNRIEFCNKMNKKYKMDLSVNISSEEFEFKEFKEFQENKEKNDNINSKGDED